MFWKIPKVHFGARHEQWAEFKGYTVNTNCSLHESTFRCFWINLATKTPCFVTNRREGAFLNELQLYFVMTGFKAMTADAKRVF